MKNTASAPRRSVPPGFGIVPERKLRGDERFECGICRHVTSGVTDLALDDLPLGGLHEITCPRCGSRLAECTSCGAETSVRRDGELWRCDACNQPVAGKATLHPNLPTLKQLGAQIPDQ